MKETQEKYIDEDVIFGVDEELIKLQEYEGIISEEEISDTPEGLQEAYDREFNDNMMYTTRKEKEVAYSSISILNHKLLSTVEGIGGLDFDDKLGISMDCRP